jgi:hypothetical protein
MIVRRVGVVSLAKVLGVLYGAIGLILGLIFSLLSVMGLAFGAAFNESGGPEAVIGAFFGIGAIILLPLFYGGIGFISGLLTAALYNLTARLVGGLEIEVD